MENNMNWIRGDCIGRGAYATVNLAHNKSNATVFAVKSVDQTSCLPSQIQALENEIRISRKVSSPYVVEYLGDDFSFEKINSCYRNLHMEYLPRGTVAAAAGELDEGIIRLYTWCIVSAVNYLHTQLNIIHCDIKGENVLVGPKGIAKLADFGSAIEVGVSEGTRGSPMWMAPEVVRGEYQGFESDVWSVGCTVIEMVTGKLPWEMGGAAADTLFRIGYSDELPKFPTKLSEVGKDFLDKCLRREVNERWSCDQLLRHPFLLSCSLPDVGQIGQSLFPSPRGVLDWLPSEDEESVEDGGNYEIVCERYRNWISGLDSGSGALWESNNGWLVVRGVEEVEEFSGEGVTLEFFDGDGGVDHGQYENEESLKYGLGGGKKRGEMDESSYNCYTLLLLLLLLLLTFFVYILSLMKIMNLIKHTRLRALFLVISHLVGIKFWYKVK